MIKSKQKWNKDKDKDEKKLLKMTDNEQASANCKDVRRDPLKRANKLLKSDFKTLNVLFPEF